MSLEQLARRIGATLVGDGNVRVEACAAIDHAGPGEVTFLANKKYAGYLRSTQAAAVLIDPVTACPPKINRLVVDDPYLAFRSAMVELHGFRQHPLPMDAPPDARRGSARSAASSISGLASIHPSAKIGQGSIIHPHAVVEHDATLGRGCVLYPGAYVGPHAKIGDECLLFPNVVIYDRCELGNRVTVHANTVIGHDGFGYATAKGEHHKIPQAGIVVIEDDVELGAGCAIERAAMGQTRIGRGTKFADLISIGHGTTIGKHCLVVSFVGISGSAEIGDYVVLGGQVGVAGHLKVGDRVQAMGRAGITQDVPAGMKVGGVPAVPYERAKRNLVVGANLSELAGRVKRLERELEKLKAENERQPGA